MENKINVAELLKGCPKGMELDCTMYDNVCFDKVDENRAYSIRLKIGKNDFIHLTKEGCWNTFSNAKCIIFPKGKTTWEGFCRPFVEGDIISTESGMYIGILKFTKDNHYCHVFCSINDKEEFVIDNNLLFSRFATEEEKQKLFDAIKANGYHWDAETKTLNRLFKFKPFDKVLVRDNKDCNWKADFYSHYDCGQQYCHICVGDGYEQCIPYNDETANLVGTTNDCPNKYKIWKDEC